MGAGRRDKVSRWPAPIKLFRTHDGILMQYAYLMFAGIWAALFILGSLLYFGLRS